NQLAQTGTTGTVYGFTGEQQNSYIKLIYMGARWYDPQIGRFVSADSIVPQEDNPQSFNRYSYVLNRPLILTDPSGHRPCDPDEPCVPAVPPPALKMPDPSLLGFNSSNTDP